MDSRSPRTIEVMKSIAASAAKNFTHGVLWVATPQNGKSRTVVVVRGFEAEVSASVSDLLTQIAACDSSAVAQRIAERLPSLRRFVGATATVNGGRDRQVTIARGGSDVVAIVPCQGDFLGGDGVREIARIPAGFNGTDTAIVLQGRPGAIYRISGYKNRTTAEETL